MSETFEQMVERVLFGYGPTRQNLDEDDRLEIAGRLRNELAKGQEPVAHCVVKPLLGNDSFPRVEVSWAGGKPIPGPLYTRPILPAPAGVLDGWNDAYSAFKAAFDNPIARRKLNGEYADEARKLLSKFNEYVLSAANAAPASAVAKDAEQTRSIDGLLRYSAFGEPFVVPRSDEDGVEIATWGKAGTKVTITAAMGKEGK